MHTYARKFHNPIVMPFTRAQVGRDKIKMNECSCLEYFVHLSVCSYISVSILALRIFFFFF